MKQVLRLSTLMVCMLIVMPVANAGGHKKDIVATAMSNPLFSTLVAAVKGAGLVDTLKSKGPFTVFAPTNEAFAALPAGTVENLLKPENKTKLIAILKHHVVSGKVMAADVSGKKFSQVTVNGTKLDIDGTTGVLVSGANVVSADVVATNGVIHVINKVLLP
ncbi:MAG: hypothetical protein CBB68_09190 [Rhodospirillaceae bacterium TMED8]|nr:Nex18 symbiotically induced protein [Magnetovibrio sp.]OUT50531.1 MAG: hypothetical protein CBB68_09190 [Rhodospirillaceae bacterium TMED8]